jgi:cytochrome P450 PksS
VKPIKAALLARPRFKADPYPFYARMRAESPVFPISAFRVKAWLVTRYDDVVTVLTDERFSKDISAKMRWLPRFTRPLTHHMLNRDAPDHTRLRGLVNKAFTRRRIEPLEGRIRTVCDGLLDSAARSGRFDLVRGYALPIPLTIISELLGIPEKDRLRFHRLTRGSLPLGAPTRAVEVALALVYAWLLMRFFRKLFAARRREPRDDLVTALVEAEEGGDHLSEQELMGMVILLLLAGYETTVNLIGSGALALLQHPGQRRRFVEDPGLAESGVEELLRYTSPVEIAPPRLTRDAVRLASVTIPRGELVAAVVGSANHDETRFADPEVLDLAREPNRHVAFGQGAHFCLGAPLAQMEGRLALTTLFRRFPDLRLARPASSLRWRRMVPLRGLRELPVRLP